MLFYLFVLTFNLVLASIELNNYTFKTTYAPFDDISGKINLTIIKEANNLEFSSNQGGEITLKELLNLNKKNYSCYPRDCSQSYDINNGAEDKTFQINSETIYAGFFLKGKDVKVTSLNFSIESDFSSLATSPLKIKFFNEEEWQFNKFSKTEFTSKNWGCYNQRGSPEPLIKTSSYCELINITETNSLMLGALVDSGDDEELRMSLYTGRGNFIQDCSYNPTIEEECLIESESEIFPNGTYQVCVGAEVPTNYKIYKENSGVNCGFVLNNEDEITDDYAISVRTAKYASSDLLDSGEIDFESYADMANKFIEEKYDDNCTNGCILPLEITGVSQNLRIFNVALGYEKNGDYEEKSIYEATVVPAVIDFRGEIDLSFSKFNVSKEGEYSFYFGDEKLFEEEINFLPAPIIKSIYPLNSPAGVPVNIYLNVDYNGSLNLLNYKWNFGGFKSETTKNVIVYTFNEIKNYSVEVQVSYHNLTSKRNFTIETISPQLAVNSSLAQKRESLDYMKSYFGGLPYWYGEIIKQKLNFSSYNDAIEKLEEQNLEAKTDATILKIAKEIFAIDFIANVYVEEKQNPVYFPEVNDINPEAVLEVSNEKISNPDLLNKYKDVILSWQDENYIIGNQLKKIIFSKDSGTELVFWHYALSITPQKGGEGYLIINKPLNSLQFKENSGAISSDDSTVIQLDGNAKTIEFFYSGNEESSFFVSPKLSSLVVNINENCNFNKVCEPNNEETYKNCRSDCKPYSKAIIYVIFAFILFIIAYTFFQIWYKKHYENFLFGEDRRQIYNLLMFVANARARGIKDEEIIKSLKTQGWNPERVNYIMKKSLGKNVGMIEIIPISKISAFRMKRRAQKNYFQKNRETLINTGQQIRK